MCTRKLVAGNSIKYWHQAVIKPSDHGINLVRAREGGVACILAGCCSHLRSNEVVPFAGGPEDNMLLATEGQRGVFMLDVFAVTVAHDFLLVLFPRHLADRLWGCLAQGP